MNTSAAEPTSLDVVAIGSAIVDVLSRTAADDSADWQFRELRIDADSQSSIISGLVAELDETADDFDDFDTRLAAAQKSIAELGD